MFNRSFLDAPLGLVDLFLVLSIFTSGFYYISPVGVFYFSYVYVFFYVAAHLFFFKSKMFFGWGWLFWFLFFLSLISMVINGALGSGVKVFSSLMLLVIMYLAYGILVSKYFNRIDDLFKLYFYSALACSIVAVNQEVLLIIGVPPEYVSLNGIIKKMDGWWGVPGLSAEPAELAIVLIPALYYGIVRIFEDGKLLVPTLFIMLAILLSTSSLGILGVLIVAFFIFLKFFKGSFLVVLILLPIFIFIFIFLFSQEYFVMRVVDTLELISIGAYIRPEGFNLSSYSQIVNFDMVLRSIVDFNYVGVGFGNYSFLYDSYISDYYIPLHRIDIPGRGTATSMLLRFVGEIGILAVLLVVIYFYRFRSYSSYSVVKTACLIFIVLAFIRMGIYFANGTMFFLLLYAYCGRGEDEISEFK